MTATPVNPLRNPKDPLHQTGPEAEKELFKRYAQLSDGFPNEAVLGAALNIIINGVRQGHSSWMGAERQFDEIFGRTKTILRDHYDANGKRRNLFPFDQVIQVPLVKNINRF